MIQTIITAFREASLGEILGDLFAGISLFVIFAGLLFVALIFQP